MRSHHVAFGPFRIDPTAHRLWKGNQPQALPPKSVALLRYLAMNAGRLVPKEELLAQVWAGVHVTDAVLKNAVAAARLALGDRGDSHAFIETEPRRGYRFVAHVATDDLPEPLASFVGRQDELVQARRLVAGHRLTTFTGAPGCGKTRLAMELARRLNGEGVDGVKWVDLDAALHPAAVARAVAEVVGVRWRPDTTADALFAPALERRQLLLVLNECDRCLGGVACLAQRLLSQFAGLRLLLTCRSPLAIAGEQRLVVPPLAVPSHDASIAETLANESVRLFLERAVEARPSFAPSDPDVSRIAAICRRLDGLPIAVECAASWVGMLTPSEILEHLFELLASPASVGPRRRRSSAQGACDVFDRSLDRLSHDERELLERLAAIDRPFTLGDVQQLWDAPHASSATGPAIALLAQLVDQSLVVVANLPVPGASTYRLFEPLRRHVLRRPLHGREN